ncbi:MAG: hypothetical protein AAF289_05295 [Cyanobacteria bacterium P01_A01_bin.135]
MPLQADEKRHQQTGSKRHNCPEQSGKNEAIAIFIAGFSRLIAHLEQVCQQQGIGALHLEVELSNRAARLYERSRFKAHDRDFMTKKKED